MPSGQGAGAAAAGLLPRNEALDQLILGAVQKGTRRRALGAFRRAGLTPPALADTLPGRLMRGRRGVTSGESQP